MAAVPHWINIYQRPAQGSSFLRRYRAYNYQHVINAIGWYDTASCDIAVRSSGEGQYLVEQCLGSLISIYVDNPLEPIWEGLINRITFNTGGASYTISLDEMANRVDCVFTGAANAAAQTVIANNTASQAIYGIKEEQVEFGPDTTGGAANQRANLRDTILAQRAFPQASITQGQGETNILNLELIGIYHTLEWEKPFTALVATNTAAQTTINNLLAALANGATFFNNADTSGVGSSGTSIPDQQRGLSQWERIQKIAEAGDSTNYWIAGINPLNRVTRTRQFYYRQANSTIEYLTYQKDGLQIRNLYGKYIPPWRVRPDRGVRINDLLTGFSAPVVSDPRQAYIQSIQYDANSQKVQWYGADDTTARAAFMLKRGFKPMSRQFGAPFRTIST